MEPTADRVKVLFHAAFSLADGSERSAFLDRECGADAELRRRVEALLGADPATEFLERPASHGPPDRGLVLAGRYRLDERLGQGGMGTVWRAEQASPVRRQVAVKLIRPGLDSAAVLTRFAAERQALALMDHPNIARVFDAGAAPDGRPFFAMELVAGEPITAYCDGRRLTPRERLELFIPVCRAVQHAHQKGVIHRDLKPSNVLVAEVDGLPVPKVIDFGIAKAADVTLTDAAFETGAGMVVGTPEYMAPEQADPGRADVDTRADVYALGVLLYELLTGSTPVDRKSLGRAALLEVLRVVREVDPPRPSARLSTSDALPGVAAVRSTDPRALTGLLRSELDWVVMKALEKDRERRYDTAAGFAADVERYLAGEPVLAVPPSRAYRLRTFARRNRPQVIAAALLVATLTAGLLGTGAGLAEARRQRDAAEGARAQAEKRLAQVTAGSDLLGSVFTDLDPWSEAVDRRPLPAVLGERLAAAADRLRGDALGDPVTVARLQVTLGRSLLGLRLPAAARPLFAEAASAFEAAGGAGAPEALLARMDAARADLMAGRMAEGLGAATGLVPTLESVPGVGRADVLDAQMTLAQLELAAGRPGPAVPRLERALAEAEAALGPDHSLTLRARGRLAAEYSEAGRLEEAARLLERTLAARVAALAGDHPASLHARHQLALARIRSGQGAEGIKLLEENVALAERRLGADSPDVVEFRADLADGYGVAGDPVRAADLLGGHLAAAEAKLGADHPSTLAIRQLAVEWLSEAGRLDQARKLGEQNLAAKEAALGPDHPGTLASLYSVSLALKLAGRPGEALPPAERALAGAERHLGEGHPSAVRYRNHLAGVLAASGRLDRAIALYEKNLALDEARLAPGADRLTDTRTVLANAYASAGRFDDAIPLNRRSLAESEARRGVDHPATLLARNSLAVSYLRAGRPAEAVPILERTVALGDAKIGAEAPNAVINRFNLAGALKDSGRLDRAEPLYRAAVEQAKGAFGPDHPTTQLMATRWADALQALGRAGEAVPVRRGVVAAARKAQPPDAPRLAKSLAGLGDTLLALGKPGEAEPPLREAVAVWDAAGAGGDSGRAARSLLGECLTRLRRYPEAEAALTASYGSATAPPALGAATADRLVRLYAAWGKPEQAAKWRAERAKYPPEVAPMPRRLP